MKKQVKTGIPITYRGNLSKRTKEYQKYVKDMAKLRGNNAIDDLLPSGSTVSSRNKNRIYQRDASVNNISRTLEPFINQFSPERIKPKSMLQFAIFVLN